MRRLLHSFVSQLRIVTVPLAAIIVLLVVFAVVLARLGTPNDKIVLAVAPATVTVLVALFVARLQDITRHGPKLAVSVAGASAKGVILQPLLPPWPVDVDRIVANETHDARQTICSRSKALDTLGLGAGLMAFRPSEQDHQRAREAFLERVSEYEKDVRAWVEDYRAAAVARHETFELTLTISNRGGAAHADAVTLALDLPPRAAKADGPSPLELPPATPRYQPPRPRTWSGDFPHALGPQLTRSIDTLRWDSAPVIGPFQRAWQDRGAGCMETDFGDLQPGRTVTTCETLRIRVNGPGPHEVAWSVYSKSLGQPVRGTITLVVPDGDPKRPAIGKITGILAYPDAVVENPVTDPDDEDLFARNAKPVRNSNPPLVPPTAEPVDPASNPAADLITKLQASERFTEWQALGLDPVSDCPPPPDVRRPNPSPVSPGR